MRWVKLEPIIKSEVSQEEKHQYSTLLLLSLLSCVLLVRPHRWPVTRVPHPWDSLGKNTGVGCYFLLQFMKVKSESEVAQSCPLFATPWTAAY